MKPKRKPREMKRIQVDLDRTLQAKLEELRQAYSLTSQTEAVRAAIAIAVRAAESELSPSRRDVGRRSVIVDPLDLDSDFESSLRLARLSRRRFVQNPDPRRLTAWGAVLRELAASEPDREEDRQALDRELLLYDEAREQLDAERRAGNDESESSAFERAIAGARSAVKPG